MCETFTDRKSSNKFDLSQNQIFFNKKRAKSPLEQRIIKVLLIFERFFDQMSESESFNVC